jgi:hypothetical protein
MLARRLRPQIEASLERLPGVVLLGPRQVGKTTLGRKIASSRGKSTAVYLDLERPLDLRRLSDADSYLRAQTGKLVVIDEIHRAPELFAVLRGVIDESRAKGKQATRFLLLGSAAIDLMRQASETLAGRIRYLELAPIGVLELPAKAGTIERLWVRGGFPDSLLAADEATSLEWRQSFIRSYLERDVPMFAPRMPAETIRRLWTMLAHTQGAQVNLSRLASSLAVSAPAVARYVDLLVDLLLVRRLQPWSGNVGKRLARTPKLYIRDSGLAHALLDVESLDGLLAHPVAGPSWEGFAVENIIAAAADRYSPSFYRTADGAEVDLLLERGGKVEMAIEIKRSTAPTLSRGFRSAQQVLKPKESFLVHGGSETWNEREGVTAIGLPALLTKLAESAGP